MSACALHEQFISWIRVVEIGLSCSHWCNWQRIREKMERRTNCWLTFPQAEGKYIHTSYWSWCLATLLCSSLEEPKLARLIPLRVHTHTGGVGTTYTVKKVCVPDSTLVCSSYNIVFLVLKLVLQPQGPDCLPYSSSTFLLHPEKKKLKQKAAWAVSTGVLISPFFLSLPLAFSF